LKNVMKIVKQWNQPITTASQNLGKDSFVVNLTLVFQIKFCGKSPALRKYEKRW
jgi:hypothetical protein